jgi:hypothetical protein
MSVETHQTPKVGDRIVRAWFDTVLNPLLQGLATESSLLAEGNLTWRFQQHRFASLVPVRQHIFGEAWDNLDQFLSLNPDYVVLLEGHDRDLDALGVKCRALENRLSESEALLQLLDRVKSSIGDLHGYRDFREIFGAIEPANYSKLVAEYIINNTETLPSYYTTAEFWNRYHEQFLKVREVDENRPFWDAMKAEKDKFSATVDRLATALKTRRHELSISANVPIVERVR